MNKDQLIEVIENNYDVIMSVDGTRNVQTSYAKRFFRADKEYKTGTIMNVPHHNYPCSLVNVFIAEQTKTVFLAFTEVE